MTLEPTLERIATEVLEPLALRTDAEARFPREVISAMASPGCWA